MITKEDKQRRIQYDTDNAAWLLPLREAFHTYLVDELGYQRPVVPNPGATYPGSHAQMLWECWLAASLRKDGDLQQALTDPENQPSQFGTVPLEMYQALEKKMFDIMRSAGSPDAPADNRE